MMHWWHSAFSSRSQSDDDGAVIVGDESRSSLRSSFFSSRRSCYRIRSRKVQQVSKNGDVWRSLTHLHNSPSKAAPAAPLPLPLPELRVLPQHDPKATSSGSNGVPLPSPDSIQNHRGTEEKERDRDREREATEANNAEAIDGGNGPKRLRGHDSQTNAEHSETSISWDPEQKQKPKAKSLESFNFNNPSSALTSPYASPAPSPPRYDQLWSAQYTALPGICQTWSAPEMLHCDGNQGHGFSIHQPWEKTAPNFGNSSPGVNSHLHAATLAKPVSLSTLVRWENNIPAIVHPLPRPPGAAMSSQLNPVVGSKSDFHSAPVNTQPNPVSSLTKPEFPVANIPAQPSPISPGGSKPEVKPIKSQWQKGKLIGRGTFGSVYVASNRETGALCAMKEVEILPDDSKSDECLRQLEQEIKVLSQLKHPNIVQYFGSEIIGDKFNIYLEYVHPGSINKFIHDHCGAITESVVRNFTRHILCGLAYLHSTKTIHRDIKGANLLVDAYGVVKLADFGMAKHLTGQTANLSLKGSPYWMAPELLQSSMQANSNSDIALAVDIWSLGCTIIEMMDGKPPWSEYEGPAALFRVLKETPPLPEMLSDDGKDFLQCCFRRNPADRPSASKLLEHPFVNNPPQHDGCALPLKDARVKDNVHLPRRKSDPFLSCLSRR